MPSDEMLQTADAVADTIEQQQLSVEAAATSKRAEWTPHEIDDIAIARMELRRVEAERDRLQCVRIFCCHLLTLLFADANLIVSKQKFGNWRNKLNISMPALVFSVFSGTRRVPTSSSSVSSKRYASFLEINIFRYKFRFDQHFQ